MIASLDPGFGNTKLVIDGQVAVLQTAVADRSHIGRAATGMRLASRAIEVSIAGRELVAGPGAWNWGRPITSFDYSAFATPERMALLMAALSLIGEPGYYAIDELYIALPVELLQNESQAQQVFRGLKALKGTHEAEIGGESFAITIEHIRAIAQPVGAWADWAITDDLRIRRHAMRARAAVLDIGMNTVDLYAVQGGQVLPRYVGGGREGVRRILEQNGHEIVEADALLRAGRLPLTGEMTRAWLARIMAIVERTWDLRNFDAVILTGGGAVILNRDLIRELSAAGAAVHMPEDPIAANAIGIWKWAVYRAQRRKTA